MDPVVKSLTCPSCSKATNVRILPSVEKHVYHCPHCKKIVSALAT